MEWNLEVKDIFSNKSEFYTFNKEKITIGRGQANDIVIQNQYISDKHLTLNYIDGNYTVKDEKSSNGSEININNKWKKLSKKMTTEIPIQLKLAKAVVINIQSNESQLITLKELGVEEAIMVLDICDSTKMAFINENIAFHIKKRLVSISKPVLYSCNVNLFKNTGDGFLATFAKTAEAYKAAKKILESLEKRNLRTNHALIQVRIALHKGKTYVIDPTTCDIHGNDINITFRMEGLKKRSFDKLETEIPEVNRILCSKYFYDDYLANNKKGKAVFKYCGKAKMKGIRKKIEVYYVEN